MEDNLAYFNILYPILSAGTEQNQEPTQNRKFYVRDLEPAFLEGEEILMTNRLSYWIEQDN
jgi:hypothetical protein